MKNLDRWCLNCARMMRPKYQPNAWSWLGGVVAGLIGYVVINAGGWMNLGPLWNWSWVGACGVAYLVVLITGSIWPIRQCSLCGSANLQREAPETAEAPH